MVRRKSTRYYTPTGVKGDSLKQWMRSVGAAVLCAGSCLLCSPLAHAKGSSAPPSSWPTGYLVDDVLPFSPHLITVDLLAPWQDRYGLTWVALPTRHYAIWVSPCWKVETVKQKTLSGPAVEVGGRYYTGRLGAHGAFAGVAFGTESPREDAALSWLSFGVDLGFQELYPSGFSFGVGAGVRYTPREAWSTSLTPRINVLLGWAF